MSAPRGCTQTTSTHRSKCCTTLRVAKTSGALAHLSASRIALLFHHLSLQLMHVAVSKLPSMVACQCCCYRQVKQAQLHLLHLQAHSFKKLLKCLRVWPMSTLLCQVTQQFLELGRSFLTCAQAQCQVAAQSKQFFRQQVRKWHTFTISLVARRRALAIRKFLMHRLAPRKVTTTLLLATPA